MPQHPGVGATALLPSLTFMARSSTKWPTDLDPLIIAEANNGTGPAAIIRLIRKGELEGMEKPYEVPNGTFWDHWKKLKPLIDPSAQVPEGEEIQRAGNIKRQAIAIMDKEIKRIESAQRKGRLASGDVATLRQLAKTASEIERAMSPTSAKGAQRAATEAARDVISTPLQERAAKFVREELEKLEDEGRDEPASEPPNSDGANEDGEARETDGGEDVLDSGRSDASANGAAALYSLPG